MDIQCNTKFWLISILILLTSCGQHTADYYGFKNAVETTTVTRDDSERARLAEHIQNDNLDALKEMIDQGVDLNIPLPNGNPPIIEAILWERVEVIRLLLKHGANRECVDSNGNSATRLSEDSSEEIYDIFHPKNFDSIEEE